MTNVQIKSKGNSGAEDRFIELFCDTFGAERDSMFIYSTRWWTFTAATAPLILH